MMIAPGSVSDSAQGVFALLAVLADPKACKALLEELKSFADEGAKLQKDAQQSMVVVKAKEDDLAGRENALAESLRGLALRQAAMSKAETDLSSDRARFAAARSTFDAEKSAFDTDKNMSMAALGEREQAVSLREIQADKTMNEAVKLKAEYEAKTAKLKALV